MLWFTGQRKTSRSSSMRATKTISWVSTNATLPRVPRPPARTPALGSATQQSNKLMAFLLRGKKKWRNQSWCEWQVLVMGESLHFGLDSEYQLTWIRASGRSASCSFVDLTEQCIWTYTSKQTCLHIRTHMHMHTHADTPYADLHAPTYLCTYVLTRKLTHTVKHTHTLSNTLTHTHTHICFCTAADRNAFFIVLLSSSWMTTGVWWTVSSCSEWSSHLLYLLRWSHHTVEDEDDHFSDSWTVSTVTASSPVAELVLSFWIMLMFRVTMLFLPSAIRNLRGRLLTWRKTVILLPCLLCWMNEWLSADSVSVQSQDPVGYCCWQHATSLLI